jgi:hypothetical protein
MKRGNAGMVSGEPYQRLQADLVLARWRIMGGQKLLELKPLKFGRARQRRAQIAERQAPPAVGLSPLAPPPHLAPPPQSHLDRAVAAMYESAAFCSVRASYNAGATICTDLTSLGRLRHQRSFYEASRMADIKARTKVIVGRGNIASALVRSANLVIMKVVLILTAVFVALSIGMTLYYRNIIYFLLF